MNPKERIMNAVHHKETDRVPIDFGGTRNTSVATIAYDRLLKKLGINNRLVKTVDFIEQASLADLDVGEVFHSDIIDCSHAFFNSEKDFEVFTIPNKNLDTLIPKYIGKRYEIETDSDDSVLMKYNDGTILGKMPKSAVHIRQTYWPYGDLPKFLKLLKMKI